MLTGLLKVLTAAAIALGIVVFVTGGDFVQVSEAARKAWTRSAETKQTNIAARDAEPKPIEASGPVKVVIRNSQAQRIERVLTLTGATEMSRSVEIRAEVAGLVAIAPPKGVRVREGDLLCRLELGDRGARRAAIIARLQQSETELRAQAQLSNRGFAAANAASAARSNAEVLRAELAQMEIEMRRLEIRAPFDGIIEAADIQVGGYLQPGNSCATLIDPDPVRVAGFVSERDLPSLRIGGVAQARLATGEAVAGRIAFIAQTADPATRTFEVEVEIPNPDYRLRAAVTATLQLPLAAAQAQLVPQSALTLSSEGALGVMVVEAGTARFKPVELVRDNDRGAWVNGLDGLAQIIVVGQEYVSDGSPVETTVQSGDILGSRS